MLRIAVHNTDPEHPAHALFQAGEPLHNHDLAPAALEQAQTDFPSGEGYVAVVQEFVDNGDETSSWVEVA